MRLRTTTKYRYPNGDPRLFYGCANYPRCDMVCAAHPDGRPASIPADAETKAARGRAHQVFDRIWKSGWLTQKGAYRWLQRTMNMTVDQAHIGHFTKDQCEQLIGILSRPGMLHSLGGKGRR
jgi:hypothetical protein